MVKPNFLVDKPNIKHKPSIFNKKIWINAGRFLKSLAFVRGPIVPFYCLHSDLTLNNILHSNYPLFDYPCKF